MEMLCVIDSDAFQVGRPCCQSSALWGVWAVLKAVLIPQNNTCLSAS